jgi:hypothetical protein
MCLASVFALRRPGTRISLPPAARCGRSRPPSLSAGWPFANGASAACDRRAFVVGAAPNLAVRHGTWAARPPPHIIGLAAQAPRRRPRITSTLGLANRLRCDNHSRHHSPMQGRCFTEPCSLSPSRFSRAKPQRSRAKNYASKSKPRLRPLVSRTSRSALSRRMPVTQARSLATANVVPRRSSIQSLNLRLAQPVKRRQGQGQAPLRGRGERQSLLNARTAQSPWVAPAQSRLCGHLAWGEA